MTTAPTNAPTAIFETREARRTNHWVAVFPAAYGCVHVQLPLRSDLASREEALAYATENADSLNPGRPMRLYRVNGKLVAA